MDSLTRGVGLGFGSPVKRRYLLECVAVEVHSLVLHRRRRDDCRHRHVPCTFTAGARNPRMPSRQHVNAISAGCVSLPSSSVSCVQAVCVGRCMSVAALCIAHHRARQVSCMLHVACDIKRRLLHVACAALHVTFCVQCSMRTARCRRCPRSLGSGRTHSVADRYDVVRRVQYDRCTLYAVGQVYVVQPHRFGFGTRRRRACSD